MSTIGGGAKVQLASSLAWTLEPSFDTPTVTAEAKPAFGDLNADGLLDVMVGSFAGTAVTGYVNTGTASAPIWSPAPSWNQSGTCGNNASSPALADLNGDGLLDMIVGTSSRRICVFQNTGTPSAPVWTRNSAWEIAGTVSQFWTVAMADLDNDGLVDLVLGTNTTGIVVYRNTGTSSVPAWTLQSSWANVPGLSGLTRLAPALADIDGDGDYDMLIGEGNGAVLGYENTGSPTAPAWTAHAAWNIADPNGSVANIAGPALGDLNGDGLIDLLYGDTSGVAFGYRNSGSFISPGTYTSKVVDAGSHGGFDKLNYSAVVPSGTTLTVDIRAGDNPDPNMGVWTAWLTSVPSGGNIASLGFNQYVQYRINLGTTNAAVSPKLYSVQATTNAPAPLPVVAAVVINGDGGGGELNIMELMFLCLLLLFGRGRKYA